jgi:hypothetical protein
MGASAFDSGLFGDEESDADIEGLDQLDGDDSGYSAVSLEDTFCDYETSCERSVAFATFLFDTLEDVLKALQIVVIEPADGGAGDLQAFLNGKVDASISHDDVATFCKCSNGRGNCGESLRVNSWSQGDFGTGRS